MSNLVIISGMIRSGTTLIARILNAHQNIGIASDILLPVMKSLKSEYLKNKCGVVDSYITDGYFDSPIDDLVFDVVLDNHIHKSVVDDMLINLSNYLYMEPSLKEGVRRIDTSCYRSIITGIIDEINNLTDKKNIVGIKEAYFDEFLPVFRSIYPELKTIHIIRNPLAVFSSIVAQETSYPLIYAIKFWRRHVDLAIHNKAKHPENTLIIRYEDVISSSSNTIKKMTSFLGENYSEYMLDESLWKHIDGSKWKSNSSFNTSGRGIYSTSKNDWKSRLDDDQINTVKQLCAPELEVYYRELSDLRGIFMSESYFLKALVRDKERASIFPKWLPSEYSYEMSNKIWSQEKARYLSYYNNDVLEDDSIIKNYLSLDTYKYVNSYR